MSHEQLRLKLWAFRWKCLARRLRTELSELREKYQRACDSAESQELRALAAEEGRDGPPWARIQTLIGELSDRYVARTEKAEAECKAWRDAHGPFGPQTPDEVGVFKQEASRVDAECAAHAKLELQKANDRLVEHKQRNRELNESCQAVEKCLRLCWADNRKLVAVVAELGSDYEKSRKELYRQAVAAETALRELRERATVLSPPPGDDR